MKCWGCNSDKIPLFTWLAGDDLCRECKNKITSPEVTANYKQNILLAAEKRTVQNKKTTERGEKITRHGKNILSFIFGGIALLWFIIMLPAQPDFFGIVVGWIIIGFIYSVFKMFSY